MADRGPDTRAGTEYRLSILMRSELSLGMLHNGSLFRATGSEESPKARSNESEESP